MAPEPEHGTVDDENLAFEDDDARTPKGADRAPTADEEKAADSNELDPEVARSYEEAIERGASVKGEGQVP